MKSRQWIPSYHFLALMGIWTLFLTSCVAEHLDNGDEGANKSSSVRISLQMPSASAHRTYAISAPDENEVETIDILAFRKDNSTSSGWAFAYKVQGTSITNKSEDGLKKQFDATLYQMSGEQTFVVLANVRNEVEGLGDIAIGADKNALLKRLVCTDPDNWDTDPFRPFPMWGEKTLVLTVNTTEITELKMLRSIARLDVVLSEQVTDAGSFVLKEVYIYNSKKKGYIVPASGNIPSGTTVTAATIPEDLDEYKLWNNPSSLSYLVPTAMKNAFERTVYLFESKAVPKSTPSKATCVVVGGKYGADSEASYYRVDLITQDETPTFRDILRNHQYRINISKVSGTGFPTPDDAFNSKTVNMEAEVVDWDNGGDTQVIIEGQHMLSVDPGKLSFSRDPETKPLTVYTDYPAGWSIEKIVETADGTTLASWITVSNASPGDANMKQTLSVTVTENNTSSERSAWIVVAAGRMRYKVVVSQSTVSELKLSIVNPHTGNELNEMLFASGKDMLPAARLFAVNWLPTGNTVAVTTSSVGTYPAFTYQGGSDAISTGTLPAGGNKTYTIQPTPFTSAQLGDANPFPERITQVEYKISNGVETVSRNIILRQIVYNLIPDKEVAYLMNGGEHSFTVKSNYPWKAEIVQWGDEVGKNVVTKLVTTNGDANTTTGVQVKFETSEDLTNPSIYAGTAKVKFTCLYDESVTETVDLLCVSGDIQEESNCYIVKPGGTGILIPVSRANKAVANSIGTEATYSSDLLWTDNSNGLAVNGAVSRIIVAGKGGTGYILVIPGTGEGNAVVTVEVNSIIKWSWHIWTTDYVPNSSTSTSFKLFANTVPAMDRNLGAWGANLSTTQKGVSMSGYWQTGLFYQWGRKDPFIGANGWSGTGRKTIYKADKTTYSSPNTITSGYTPSPANPGTWYSENRGSNGSSSWGNSKTIYDPCPKGWKVPNNSAWNNVPMNWQTSPRTHFYSTQAGRFPAAGYYSSGGNLTAPSKYAWTWSSTPNGDSRGMLLGGDTNAYIWRGNYDLNRAIGAHVRCVKE